MPGLTGFIDYTKNSEQKDLILQNMIRSMKHKDSYGVDRHVSERIAIARIHLGPVRHRASWARQAVVRLFARKSVAKARCLSGVPSM